MYRASILLYKRLFAYVVLYVCGELFIAIFNELSTSGGHLLFASVINSSILAYMVHVEILLPKLRNKPQDSKYILGFALRVSALGLPIIIAPLIVYILIANLPFAANKTTDAILTIGFIFSLPFILILYVIIFSLFGTILPAYVARREQDSQQVQVTSNPAHKIYIAKQNQGLLQTIKRGKRQFWQTAWQLLVGPVIFYALPIILIILLIVFAEVEPLLEGWQPNWLMLLFIIVADSMQAFAIVMASWILSNAYLSAQEQPSKAML